MTKTCINYATWWKMPSSTSNNGGHYVGEDEFTYQICDLDGLCDTAIVSITVTPVNDAPVAKDDSATTEKNSPVTVNVAANDIDVDGNLDPTTVEVVSGQWRPVTPNQNYVGEDEFTYQICDLDGLCDTAIVSITVTPVNDAPVSATTEKNSPR